MDRQREIRIKGRLGVLIADSSKSFCGQLRLELEHGGKFQVLATAQTTQQMMDLIQVHHPDMVVMDLTLPGQDALSVLMAMRTMDSPPEVLALTKVASGYVFRCLVSLGVSYFLCKPCPAEMVISHLEAIYEQCFVKRSRFAGINWGENRCAYIPALLRELGISANLKGYRHLCRAIEIAVEDPSATVGITKTLYPVLAREADTKPDRVERNIRTAINAVWKNATPEMRARYFGASGVAKPSNSRFIEVIARLLRLCDDACWHNG